MTGRLVLAWMLALSGGGAALATLLGFLGRYWWGFDILSSFRTHYLMALVIVGALYGALVGWGGAALMGVAALVNLAVIVPYYLADRGVAAEGAEVLEVVTFNVQASNPRRADIMEWVRGENADLVFLTESSFEWEDAAVAADLQYQMLATVPDSRAFGITLLVRADRVAEVRRLQIGFRPAVEAVVTVDGAPVHLLAIHPLSPTSKRRSELRDEYLREVSLWARGRAGSVVIVGDFNATPWSSSFRRLKSSAGLRNSMSGHGLQPTWPSGLGPLMIPIDHALHSPDLTVVERRTGPSLGSDHRPLIVTFARARS